MRERGRLRPCMLRYSQRRIARHTADCKIYTFVSFRTCLQYTGPNTLRWTTLWSSTSRSIGRRHPDSNNSSYNSSHLCSNHCRAMSARIAARATNRGMLYGDTLNTNAARILDSSARIVVTGRSNDPICPHISSTSTWVSRFTWLISKRGSECLDFLTRGTANAFLAEVILFNTYG